VTIPGAGGQTPPRPDQQYQAQPPVPVAPGGQPSTVRAQLIIVSGPSGKINGIFIYEPGTTPGAGNGPVLSGTEAATDPYGNTVDPGWAAYGPGGALAQLLEGLLSLSIAGMSAPATIELLDAAHLSVSSGLQSAADSAAAVFVGSRATNGGQSLVQLFGDLLAVPVIIQPTVTGDLEIENDVTVTEDLHVSGTLYGAAGTLTVGDALQVNNGLAVTGNVDMNTSTIDIANGNIDLNMAAPAHYPLPTTGGTTQVNDACICLNDLIQSMINRQLIA
jgi:hypothetical protein